MPRRPDRGDRGGGGVTRAAATCGCWRTPDLACSLCWVGALSVLGTHPGTPGLGGLDSQNQAFALRGDADRHCGLVGGLCDRGPGATGVEAYGGVSDRPAGVLADRSDRRHHDGVALQAVTLTSETPALELSEGCGRGPDANSDARAARIAAQHPAAPQCTNVRTFPYAFDAWGSMPLCATPCTRVQGVGMTSWGLERCGPRCLATPMGRPPQVLAEPVSLREINCRERLGGAIKHNYRSVAWAANGFGRGACLRIEIRHRTPMAPCSRSS